MSHLVRLQLPSRSHDGHVWIGDREVSNLVCAGNVSFDVHEMTQVTLYLSPRDLDVTAEGVGVVSGEAHFLLEALGWTPPGEPVRPILMVSDARVVNSVANAIAECMHNRDPDWDEVAVAAINAMPGVSRDAS